MSHADMVAEASQRARELLLACHDEKWRREKTSPCYEAIAKAPLADIARRTLAFMCNGPIPQDKAIALVITHIEAEDYARLAMALGGTYEKGIERFRLSRQAHANHLEQLARMPKLEWQYDEQGNKRSPPFEDCLKALFPLPKYKGKRAQAERLRRFSLFLTSVVRDEHPTVVAAEEKRRGISEQEKWGLLSKEERGQIRVAAVGRLEKMKCDGIPPELLRAAILWIPLWYDEHLSYVRKKASEKAHAAKKKNRPPPTSFS